MIPESYSLWKSVENFAGPPLTAKGHTGDETALPRSTSPRRELPKRLRACSNCAGNYEDPELTAGDVEADADKEGEDREREEFPMRRK